MKSQYILPLVMGIGIGFLFICILFLSRKLLKKRGKKETSTPTKAKKQKKPVLARTPTIVPHNIPGFMLPTWRNVRVQEPLRRTASEFTDGSSDDLDVDSMKPRNNNEMPVSTVIKTRQCFSDGMRRAKREHTSPKITPGLRGLNGSISLQDLNVSAPKHRSTEGSPMGPQARLKFALYHSAASGELNVTVVSVANLSSIADIQSVKLCVWVQVEFSKYHQEFRTKKCSDSGGREITFNETCVVSDFPVEHFAGTKISFRVIANDLNVIAEAVHVALGSPPSFPKNEIIELANPGLVQSHRSRKSGEMFIRLKYDPVDESVTLGVIECRALKIDRKRSKLPDTYVKVQVIYRDEIVQKFKTKLVAKSSCPKYDKTVTISGFSRAKMTETLIKLSVISKSIPKHNLGYVLLGRNDDKTSSGHQHWESIIDKPSLDIVQWHTLKPARSMTP